MTTSTLTLSREQRALLFASGCPRISGTGKAPVDKGYVYRLSKLVELRVLRVSVRRDTQGESWWLHYEVIDRRDPKRLLRRTPTILAGDFDRMRRERDEYGYPTPITGEEAAEESAYTTGGKSAIADAGEAVPDDERQRAIWAKSKAEHADSKDAEVSEALGRALTLEQKLVELARLAERRSVKCRSEFRQVERLLGRDDRGAERILRAVEDRVRRKAA